MDNHDRQDSVVATRINAHFIVTIHNKEFLIKKVVEGITNATKGLDILIQIIAVLDGCTDNSESELDNAMINLPSNYKLIKIYLDDVHELISINHAINYLMRTNAGKEDLIFFLQDDVILEVDQLPLKVEYLYSNIPRLGYISFRCGLSTDFDANGLLYEHTFYEAKCGHWNQLNLNHFVPFGEGDFMFCEICIKSPTCIKMRVLQHVGILDENLAPFGHDDLDLCIRLNLLGYKNAIYGINFNSKLEWGGTRMITETPNHYSINYNRIVMRNKLYLSTKHREYYLAKKQ